MSALSSHHVAMLLKYSGISFISGAVNHGFFSSERSYWTAAIGVLLFALGAAMEHRLGDASGRPSGGLLRTLVLGALLSIGLGFFTGGLQHFPDSPARSAWVVPLGFLISVPALAWSQALPWRTGSTLYTLVGSVLVALGSAGAWQWLVAHPQWLPAGHSHGPVSPSMPQALVVSRSLEVTLDDRMRFTPSQIEAQAGETLRLVVRNTGQVEHELVLGSASEIREHAELMKAGGDHAHGHGGMAIRVAPGQTGELVVQLPAATTLEMACLIPGHYEAGMKGTLTVLAGAARLAPTGAAMRAQPASSAEVDGHAHSHGDHSH